jgi:hypothetical protein
LSWVLACTGVVCNYITKSPKHLDDTYQEKTMTTQISTKLAALAVALMMNAALVGGVAFLFNSQVHQAVTAMSVAHRAAPTTMGAI